MHYYLYGLLGLSSLFLVYTSVTPISTAMVLLYRFYCIFCILCTAARIVFSTDKRQNSNRSYTVTLRHSAAGDKELLTKGLENAVKQ